MIDRWYFDEGMQEQIERVGSSVSIRIHLVGGSMLDLFQVEEVRDGFVCLHCYPLDGSAPRNDPDKDERDGIYPKMLNSVRVCVPYESIAFVEVTAESTARKPIGFATTGSASA